ncbi:amino acid-binding ACT domain protein [Corynebacterium aquatimens]|uniref:amino acid-binding ACT domain protein n=1 Tax=Corynebacterium TaxID=1716 RepID=UPI001F3D3ACC|nr:MULTISPECIES: amino acid-binding ACT domain protein [Corynebacterium]QYH19858.1 amino acid-binding ACT domain protein [Corynebacterium aquatimens]UIZ92991.1 amino acid-binding ACT domain protein [Corynebacterium sp. CNCTC7651]
MSYLIRVSLPDVPGSLGELAEAFGLVGANIQSVDIVQTTPDGSQVTDDIVVALPTGTMIDTVVTAAASIEGVEVDSIRPFTGRVDRRGQVKMLARVAAQANNRENALEELVAMMPRTMTSSWAVILRNTAEGMVRVASSPAAPGDDGSKPPRLELAGPRVLDPETEEWVPEAWGLLDTALCSAPLPGTDLVLVVGRVGGPDYLASEVTHIGDLGAIIGAMLS